MYAAVVGGAGAKGADSNNGLEEFPAPSEQSLHHVFCAEAAMIRQYSVAAVSVG